MTNYNKVFQRLEKKYMLTPEKFNILMDMLNGETESDEYGKYTICNLYLDTPDYSLIRASIEKPLYKEKLRIRSYGRANSDDKVFLELKKKFMGTVYKRRVSMPECEAEAYIKGGLVIGESSQILKEIDWTIKRYQPAPTVFLAYERMALKGIEDNNLRITFDTDMRWRTEELTLDSKSWGYPIIEGDNTLMEIKALGALPVWLTKILTELEIFPCSFSKYGTCYKSFLSGLTIERGYTCA